MFKNNKGYSIVELLAMIMITSIIIYPLMASLVKNIEINERLRLRQSATTIANEALYGMEKLEYAKLFSILHTANTDGNYYVELNGGDFDETISVCDNFLVADSSDAILCANIFNLQASSFGAGSLEYKIFLYNFNIPGDYKDDLTADVRIPSQVRDVISSIVPNDTRIPNTPENPDSFTAPTPTTLLRVTVWIKYYDKDAEEYFVVLSGVIYDETVLK